jgi:hypothetical protein
MKEAPGSSETSVLTRATRRNNPEDTILHSHRRENLKSYILNQFLLLQGLERRHEEILCKVSQQVLKKASFIYSGESGRI